MKHARLMTGLLGVAAMLLLAGCSSESPTAPGAVNPDVTVKSVHRDDICGQMHIGEDVDPGEVTVRGGRVTIIRGNAFEVELTGGIVSSTIFVQNSQLNAAGNGSIVGSVELEEACVMGIDGELEGQFAGSVRRGVLSATFVLQGREGLAGCHIRLHIEGDVDSECFEYSGTVMFDDREWYEEPEGAVRPEI